jgi:hypothetical protein
MNHLELIDKVLPERIKVAITTHQTHKVAPGSETLEKVADNFGKIFIARQARWRPVMDGLKALKDLGG